MKKIEDMTQEEIKILVQFTRTVSEILKPLFEQKIELFRRALEIISELEMND